MIAKSKFESLRLTLEWKEMAVAHIIFAQSGAQVVILVRNRSQILFEKLEHTFLAKSTANSTPNKAFAMR